MIKNEILLIWFLSILLFCCKRIDSQKNVGEIYFLPEDYHTVIPLNCSEFYFQNNQVYKLQINDEILINNLLNEFNNLHKSVKIGDDFILDVRYRIVINDSLLFCIDDFGRTLINSNYNCELKVFNNIKHYIVNNENDAIKIN